MSRRVIPRRDRGRYSRLVPGLGPVTSRDEPPTHFLIWECRVVDRQGRIPPTSTVGSRGVPASLATEIGCCMKRRKRLAFETTESELRAMAAGTRLERCNPRSPGDRMSVVVAHPVGL